MTKIYLVQGVDGNEIECWRWPIVAYLDESEAELHAQAGGEFVKNLVLGYRYGAPSPFDLHDVRHSTSYEVVELELGDTDSLLKVIDSLK